MAEQTAVEWLESQIELSIGIYFPTKLYKPAFNLFKEAKAMEKEQIELAYKNGANDEFEHWMNNEERKTSIGYYKRAYKK